MWLRRNRQQRERDLASAAGEEQHRLASAQAFVQGARTDLADREPFLARRGQHRVCNDLAPKKCTETTLLEISEELLWTPNVPSLHT